MPIEQMYATSVMFVNGRYARHISGIAFARSQDEAIGKALRVCKEKFPGADSYSANVYLVQEDALRQAIAEYK